MKKFTKKITAGIILALMAVILATPNFARAEDCWFICNDPGWAEPPCEKSSLTGNQCSLDCYQEEKFPTEYQCTAALSGQQINPDDMTYSCICHEADGAESCLYSQLYKDENKCQPSGIYVSCKWEKGHCPQTGSGALPPGALLNQPPQLTKPIEELISPKNSIAIPYLKYTVINPKLALTEGGYLYIPWIGEWLSAIYKVAIGAGSILAVVMIILQGMKITASGGGEEKTTAYKNIGRVVVGLVILWGSFLILSAINPDLVAFDALKIKMVEPEPLTMGEEDDVVEIPITTDIGEMVAIKGENITPKRTILVTTEFAQDIIAVAQELKQQGVGVYITDGYRSVQEQIIQILKNCQNPPGSAKCNPIENHPDTCIMVGKDPKNCPHTTGRAVDVWGTKDGPTNHVAQKYCKKDPAIDPCRKDPEQAALIAAMKKRGFCVLDSEAWHFEKPRMSGKCH